MGDPVGDGERFLAALDRPEEALGVTQNDLAEARSMVDRMTGHVQMGQTLAKLAEGISLTQLRVIRDEKLYRLHDSLETGKPMTFAEFCTTIGLSKSTVYRQLETLDKLGNEFTELQSAMGIGYRQTRLLLMAPSDVQGEAMALAHQVAAGTIDQAEADRRFTALTDRIERLEQASAGRAKLVEERDEALQKADEADSKARSAEEKRKRAEVSWKAVREENEQLRRRLDTPPRLRDPEQARLFLERVPMFGEAMGGLIEEAAQTVGHYLEEDQADLILPLARTALDTAATAIGRAVEGYAALQGVCGHLDDQFRPHSVLLAMLAGDHDLLKLAGDIVGSYEQAAQQAEEAGQ